MRLLTGSLTFDCHAKEVQSLANQFRRNQMSFIDPVLAMCADRTRLAKENPRVAGPDVWLPVVISKTDDLCGVSFDYFINWKNNQLDREFWLKCPIDAGQIPGWMSLDDKEISNLLRQHEKFKSLVKFSGLNQAGAAAVMFDDSQDWKSDTSELILARWPKTVDAGKGLAISRLNRSNIEDVIRQKSGGPIQIGRKGLIYGTSRLECFLSTTDALWPGDADLLICEKKSMRPVALIEYKKHTESSAIKFQDQRVSNYYPNPDRRKYDRLALLSEQIGSGFRIQFFTLYYSTLASELDVKLEEIVGASGSLKSGREFRFELSPDDPEVGYRRVVEEIVRM